MTDTLRELREGDQFWVEDVRGKRFTVINRERDEHRSYTKLECVDQDRYPWSIVFGDAEPRADVIDGDGQLSIDVDVRNVHEYDDG